jgi:hypothetical protein
METVWPTCSIEIGVFLERRAKKWYIARKEISYDYMMCTFKFEYEIYW